MGIFVLNRLSFPTRKTSAPFGAEAGGDGVGYGDLVVAAVGVLVCVGLAAGVGGRVCGGLFVLAVLWRLFGGLGSGRGLRAQRSPLAAMWPVVAPVI